MIAMFSPVEIIVVLGFGLVMLALAGLAAYIGYRVMRRAARDGARDAYSPRDKQP